MQRRGCEAAAPGRAAISKGKAGARKRTPSPLRGGERRAEGMTYPGHTQGAWMTRRLVRTVTNDLYDRQVTAASIVAAGRGARKRAHAGTHRAAPPLTAATPHTRVRSDVTVRTHRCLAGMNWHAHSQDSKVSIRRSARGWEEPARGASGGRADASRVLRSTKCRQSMNRDGPGTWLSTLARTHTSPCLPALARRAVRERVLAAAAALRRWCASTTS